MVSSLISAGLWSGQRWSPERVSDRSDLKLVSGTYRRSAVHAPLLDLADAPVARETGRVRRIQLGLLMRAGHV